MLVTIRIKYLIEGTMTGSLLSITRDEDAWLVYGLTNRATSELTIATNVEINNSFNSYRILVMLSTGRSWSVYRTVPFDCWCGREWWCLLHALAHNFMFFYLQNYFRIIFTVVRSNTDDNDMRLWWLWKLHWFSSEFLPRVRCSCEYTSQIFSSFLVGWFAAN